MNTVEQQLLDGLGEFTAFARKRLSDPELAADVVQESLTKALQSADRINDEASAKAWFYRILRRTIIDLYRRRDVQERALARMERELDAPPTPEEEHAYCECLNALIPALTPEYAEILRRIDLEGQPYAEVAADLGVTETNAKVRLHRARTQLRERLTAVCGICTVHGCLDCTCDSHTKRSEYHGH